MKKISLFVMAMTLTFTAAFAAPPVTSNSVQSAMDQVAKTQTADLRKEILTAKPKVEEEKRNKEKKAGTANELR